MDDHGVGPNDEGSLETLEDSSTVVEGNNPAGSSASSSPSGAGSPTPVAPPPAKTPKKGLRRFVGRFNIYIILFVILLLIGVAVVLVVALKSHNTTSNLPETSLSQNTLSQLANSDATVGTSSQVLNIQSNAVFAGNALVRGTLQVAGKLQVGSSLSLAGITVSGNSTFQQVQVAQNLTVGGNENLLGQLTVSKNLTVDGSGNFNGPLSATELTVNTLQMNGNLTLTHHLVPGGPIPSRSNGTALGSGGTTSVSGSDTAGTLNVNTGSSPAAGCFATITFSSPFDSTPHVIVTPVGSAAASVGYYVNRSTTDFSICAANAPPGSSSFAFDYWIVD